MSSITRVVTPPPTAQQIVHALAALSPNELTAVLSQHQGKDILLTSRNYAGMQAHIGLRPQLPSPFSF